MSLSFEDRLYYAQQIVPQITPLLRALRAKGDSAPWDTVKAAFAGDTPTRTAMLNQLSGVPIRITADTSLSSSDWNDYVDCARLAL